MEVVCDLGRLRRVLNLVSHVIPTKGAKPILQYFRVTAAGDTLTFEATDLEVAVRTRFEQAVVRKPGGCVAPARIVSDFVRDADATEVSFRVDGTALQLRAGSDSGNVATGEEAEFPTIPSFDGAGGIEVQGSNFLAMAVRTAFAAAKEGGRYAMNGVLIEAEGERIRFVATDGRRLALTDRPLPAGLERKKAAIVPLRGIEQFRRAIEGMEDRSKGVLLSLGEREVALKAEGTEVFSRVLEGEFPRYASVIPKDAPNVAEMDRRTLGSRLRCVSSFTSEESRSVRFQFSASGITMTARSPGRGEGRSEMEAKFRGTSAEMAFNPDYIHDALQAAEGTTEGNEVRLEFADRTSPGKFLFGEDFCYVVMPIAVDA